MMSMSVGHSTVGHLRRKVPGSNPGRVGYLSSWLCIYSAPNCSMNWSIQCYAL